MNIKNKFFLNNLVNKKRPIVCLTAYCKNIANLVDQFADIILVGDSVGPILYGFKSTREVSLEMMINHGKAVVNNSKNAIVIIDMPYGSYEKSKHLALKNANLILKKTGAFGVKLEGGIEISETIKYLVKKKINVMGHLGMLPQKIKNNQFKVYGKSDSEKKKFKRDAVSLVNSGVFAIVIEATKEKLVNEVIKDINIPTLGIGASSNCSGQILVTEDILGLTNFNAKFVKKYNDLNKKIKSSIRKFSIDVKSKKYPQKKHLY